jgi:iron(III) transport system permease protein
LTAFLRYAVPRGEALVLAALALLVFCISVLPMARLVFEALAPGGVPSIEVLRRALDNPRVWTATVNTLHVAFAGTALAVLVGGAMALLVGLSDIRAKAGLVFLFMVPLMIPPQVNALAWLQLFGPASVLLNMIGIAPPPGSKNPLYSREGIILLLGIQHAPLVFLALRAGLRSMPRELVEAARACGAGRFKVLRDVVVPLTLPPLIAGTALAFVSAVGNFGIPALLGIPARYMTLPTLIYQRLANFGPRVIAETAALSLLVGAIAFAGVLVQSWLLRRRDYRTIGAPAAPLAFSLGRWRVWVEALCWGVIAVVLLAPLLALFVTALVPAYGIRLTLDTETVHAFQQVLFQPGATARAFRNSLLLAGAAAILLTLAAVPLAYFIVWRRSRLLRLMNLAAELPYALPGVVLAIACILIFLKPIPLVGWSLYGTVWIIFVAYLARFLTLALRPAIGGLAQIDRALEEAAQMCGAGFGRRLFTVVFPLVAPLAAAGGILVYLTAVNELTVSALLWSAGAETLGVIVFALDEGGDTVRAAAVSVLSVAMILAVMGGASLFGRRLPSGVLPWRA